MRSSPLALALALATSPAPRALAEGAPASPAHPLHLSIERYLLPNGLTVILHEDHTTPEVAVNLAFDVGSAVEPPGKTGFAHLFEHLMFMGTKKVPNGRFDAIMEAGGGQNNAATSEDRTTYFEGGPSNLLETFLWLEADRLSSLPEAMTKDKVDLQRDVVRNERRQSYENRPYGEAELVLSEHLFPAGHPYHHPVIGSARDLDAATDGDVKAFFRTFYVPSNASLVIAGDFQPDEAMRLVEKHLGPLAGAPAPTPPQTIAPPLVRADRVVLEDDVELSQLTMAWLSPAAFAPGDAACDLLAAVLGGGKSSRLYQALVRDRRLAEKITFEQRGLRGAGELVLTVTAQPGHTAAELEAAVDEELGRLVKRPVSEAELGRARALVETEALREADRLSTRAELLNLFEHLLGDPRLVETRLLGRYEDVTAAEVARVAVPVLSRPRVTIHVEPRARPQSTAPAPASGGSQPVATVQHGENEQQPSVPVVKQVVIAVKQDEARPRDTDPGAAPPPLPPLAPFLPPAPAAPPGPVSTVVLPRTLLPIVTIAAVVRAGSALDPPDRPGLAAAVAMMLDDGGAGSRGGVALAEAIDALGGELTTEAEPDGVRLTLTTRSADLPAALALFSDLLLRPRFDAAEWARAKARRFAEIVKAEDDPREVADAVFVRALYGDGHPYGHAPLGTRAAIEATAPRELAAFHAAYYAPSSITLVLAGDVTPSRAQELVAAHFTRPPVAGAAGGVAPPPVVSSPSPSGLAGGPPSTPAATAPATVAAEGARLVLVDRPGAPQTEVRVGGLGLARRSPDYPAAQLLAMALGGSFTSRLVQDLRERRGITYGATARFLYLDRPGPFEIASAVRTDATVTALGAIERDLAGMRAPLAPAEIDKARALLGETLIDAFATSHEAALALADLAVHGVAPDSLRALPAQLLALTPATLSAKAPGLLPTPAPLTVLVGDAAAIEAQRQAAGVRAPVERRDARGDRVAPR